MTMMWDRFYECPDVFKMGDWWYLVYSEQASFMRKVQYFKGRTLEELKATTANDAGIWPDNREGMLDSRAFYAGKTASDGTNRYIWGWCPTRAGNDNGNVGDVEPEWAGNLVAQRLIQHEDGTLTLGVPDAIDRKYTSAQEVKVMAKDGNVTESGKTYTLAEGASVIFNRLKVHNKISFTVKASSNTDRLESLSSVERTPNHGIASTSTLTRVKPTSRKTVTMPNTCLITNSISRRIMNTV